MQYQVDPTDQTPENGQKPLFWLFGSFKNAFLRFLNDPAWAISWPNCYLLLLLLLLVNWPIIPQRWWSYDSVGPQMERKWRRKCRRMTIWCSTSGEISNPLPASKEASPYGKSRPARVLPSYLFIVLGKGESVQWRSAWSCCWIVKRVENPPRVSPPSLCHTPYALSIYREQLPS